MPTQHVEQDEHELRRRHIEEMEKRLERLSGGNLCMGFTPNCPEELHEKFLENMLAFEEQEERPLFDALVEGGVHLPPPEEMDDARLTAKLWELIRAMSLLCHYLYNTDHLSDRELYRYLWAEALRQPTMLMPHNPDFGCHIDVVGSGSDEDNRTYLKYYADEETRGDWARDWPEDEIPAHEDPPFDRDRQLPQRNWDCRKR